jgi:hypothetical protein
MSSLRLALKLSMEASGPVAPPAETKPKRKRSSSEIKSTAGNAESSDESDAGEAVLARKRSSSQVKGAPFCVHFVRFVISFRFPNPNPPALQRIKKRIKRAVVRQRSAARRRRA